MSGPTFGYDESEIRKNADKEKRNDRISSSQEEKESLQKIEIVASDSLNPKIKNIEFSLNLDETDESEVYDYISKMPKAKLGFVITQALLVYKKDLKISSMFEVVQNLSSFLGHLNPNQINVQTQSKSPVQEGRVEKPVPVAVIKPKDPELVPVKPVVAQDTAVVETVVEEQQQPVLVDLNVNPDDLFKNIFEKSKKF